MSSPIMVRPGQIVTQVAHAASVYECEPPYWPAITDVQISSVRPAGHDAASRARLLESAEALEPRPKMGRQLVVTGGVPGARFRVDLGAEAFEIRFTDPPVPPGSKS